MINWKNTAENLGLILVSILFGVVIGIGSSIVIFKSFEPIIQQAVAKETHKIENSFKTEIRKLKSRNGGQIDFAVEPSLNNELYPIRIDTLKKKRGFLGRLIGPKDKHQKP